MAKFHLSFTIGPVQAFVAQARRTRDLWAGSWLLSHLAETALAAAEMDATSVIIPYRDKRVRGRVTSLETVVGGYPNRFEIAFDSEEQAKKAAEKAEGKFKDAWKQIAEAVWEKYVAPVAEMGKNTREIWDRQIGSFWELSWVISPPQDGENTIGRLAGARKSFRNVQMEEEYGVKCSLMGDLQEISGFMAYKKKVREKQDAFWAALRTRGGEHDLNDGERLCAVAMVKRFFPHVIDKALKREGQNPSEEKLKEQTSWPSTAFFAALSWLKKLEEDALKRAKEFAEKVSQAKISTSERQAAKDAGIPWAKIDGPAWFANGLEQSEWEISSEEKKKLLSDLRELYKLADKKPIPYYALLLMDGDSMGKLLGKLKSPEVLSRCLSVFTEKVSGIVQTYDGRTIYAGGDDVLALLPAQTALEAAEKLCEVYQDSFSDSKAKDTATISGAILFAHYKHPLRRVLKTAHHLLDDIAKDRTGRDSLAMGIIQNSGLNALWSAPWKAVQEDIHLENLLDKFGTDDTEQDVAEFNASYLYNLREQYSRLFPNFEEMPGEFARLESEADILGDIAHAEYRRRMSKDDRLKNKPDETKKEVDKLMSLSWKWSRDSGNDTPICRAEENAFSFDGWRIARFLKQVKEGRMAGYE